MEYRIAKSIFCKNTILKIVYLWQNISDITISEDQLNYIISVVNKSDKPFDWQVFNEQLQEQQLREILNSQFGPLRDAIYAKAFEKFKD
jgi:His-Xaa-Ser system protein HxsD